MKRMTEVVWTTCEIILDSGSDATVLPLNFGEKGVASRNQDSFLRDAQGTRISTEGVRDVHIVFQTLDGREVVVKDTAHVSSKVDSPLISYGKLLKHGWGIMPKSETCDS